MLHIYNPAYVFAGALLRGRECAACEFKRSEGAAPDIGRKQWNLRKCLKVLCGVRLVCRVKVQLRKSSCKSFPKQKVNTRRVYSVAADFKHAFKSQKNIMFGLLFADCDFGELPDDVGHDVQGPPTTAASDAHENWLEQDCRLQDRTGACGAREGQGRRVDNGRDVCTGAHRL